MVGALLQRTPASVGAGGGMDGPRMRQDGARVLSRVSRAPAQVGTLSPDEGGLGVAAKGGGVVMGIDESYGIEPWSEDDCDWPPEPRDERADRQDDYEARREERRVNR